MKKKWLWLGIPLLFLGIIIGVFLVRKDEVKSTGVNSYLKSVTASGVDIETKVETQDYQILVNYPKTKNERINKMLESFSNDEISSFKASYPAAKSKQKGSFFQSFETYKLSPELLSFKFNLMQKAGQLTQPQNQVLTKTYDLKKGEELQLTDVLKEKADLRSISEYLYNKLSSLPKYKSLAERQALKNGLRPVAKNFDAFILDNESLTFFFQPHQINKFSNSTSKISIPLRELGEIVKPQLLVGNLKEEAKHSKVKIPSDKQLKSKELAHQKLVALTFDDGPDPQTTPRLLSILQKENVPATFFVLGNRANLYPELVKQEHALDNQVGSHTFNHLNLPELPLKQAQEEIDKTADLVQKIIGIPPQGLRPPYGATTPQIIQKAKTPIIQWSVDSLDWESKNVDQIEQVVLNEVYDGSIILMHDIYDTSVDGAERVIKDLKRQGYTFVTVNQLIEARGKLENSQVYFNAIR